MGAVEAHVFLIGLFPIELEHGSWELPVLVDVVWALAFFLAWRAARSAPLWCRAVADSKHGHATISMQSCS